MPEAGVLGDGAPSVAAAAHRGMLLPPALPSPVLCCKDYFSLLTSQLGLDVSFRITGLFTAQVHIMLPQCLKRKDLLPDNGLPLVVHKRPYVLAGASAHPCSSTGWKRARKQHGSARSSWQGVL